MTRAFALSRGLLEGKPIHAVADVDASVVWIDVVSPDAEERAALAAHTGMALPVEEEMAEMEASSRHFQDGGLHLRSFFLAPGDGRCRLTTVAMVLQPERLVTLRTSNVPSLTAVALDGARTRGFVREPASLLLRLYEAEVDGLADALERIHADLERHGEAVRTTAAPGGLETSVSALAEIRDAGDRVRLALMDGERALSFVLRRASWSPENEALLREVLRDMDSLAAYAHYLFERMDALMQETMGRIDVEQARIIKLFSVMAVALLPPTLVASLYGMNFRFMPELAWRYGYPGALLLMVLSGLVPFWWFKRRGWL